jgi:hypothetical protein
MTWRTCSARQIANRFAEYEASGSTAWDATMDVPQRPEWLKKTETKTFEQKKVHRVIHSLSTTVDDDEKSDEEAGDSEAAVVDISCEPVSSSTDVIERHNRQEIPPEIDQIAHLKRMQQEQMQALLLQQQQLSEQQTLLVEQQRAVQLSRQRELDHIAEQQRDVQLERARELTRIERERDHLFGRQAEQLKQTELVLDQQRDYLGGALDDHTEFTDACVHVRVLQCMGDDPRTRSAQDDTPSPDNNVFSGKSTSATGSGGKWWS